MATREWQERSEAYQRLVEEDLSHSQTSWYGPETQSFLLNLVLTCAA